VKSAIVASTRPVILFWFELSISNPVDVKLWIWIAPAGCVDGGFRNGNRVNWKELFDEVKNKLYTSTKILEEEDAKGEQSKLLAVPLIPTHVGPDEIIGSDELYQLESKVIYK